MVIGAGAGVVNANGGLVSVFPSSTKGKAGKTWDVFPEADGVFGKDFVFGTFSDAKKTLFNAKSFRLLNPATIVSTTSLRASSTDALTCPSTFADRFST